MTATPEMMSALVDACADLDDLVTTQTANTGTYSYDYVDLHAVHTATRPVLAAHGLAVVQNVTASDGHVEVATMIVHKSGGSMVFGPLRLPAGRGPQDAGSAITYARRYGLMAALGITSTGSDDDGGRAQTAAETPHPLSGRVSQAMADMKSLTDTDKTALREWADGRKLSGAALLNDETWLTHVESWLDERKASQ